MSKTQHTLLLRCSDETNETVWALVTLRAKDIRRIQQTQKELRTGWHSIGLDSKNAAPVWGGSLLQDIGLWVENLDLRCSERREEGSMLHFDGVIALTKNEEEELHKVVAPSRLNEEEISYVIEVFRNGTIHFSFPREFSNFVSNEISIAELPELQARSLPSTLKFLDASSAHMPNPEPWWGRVRTAYIEPHVFALVRGGLDEKELEEQIPEWLRPIHKYAVRNGFYGIQFSPDGCVIDCIPAYDW